MEGYMLSCEKSHDWIPEDLTCMVCRRCGATKRKCPNGIIRCYDADGNRIPTDGSVDEKTIRKIEAEVEELKKSRRI